MPPPASPATSSATQQRPEQGKLPDSPAPHATITEISSTPATPVVASVAAGTSSGAAASSVNASPSQAAITNASRPPTAGANPTAPAASSGTSAQQSPPVPPAPPPSTAGPSVTSTSASAPNAAASSSSSDPLSSGFDIGSLGSMPMPGFDDYAIFNPSSSDFSFGRELNFERDFGEWFSDDLPMLDSTNNNNSK